MATNLQASFNNGQLQIIGNIPLNVTDKQIEIWMKESFNEVFAKRAEELTAEVALELVAYSVQSLCSLLDIKDANTIRGYFTLDKKDPKYLPTVDGGGKKLNRVRAIEVKNWLVRNGKAEMLGSLYKNVNNRINR